MPRSRRDRCARADRHSKHREGQEINEAVKPARWSSIALVVVAAAACSRHIEEEPPIPEHRIQPCRTWCAMLFDPECPQDVEVKDEAECFEHCTTNEPVWGPTNENGDDPCAATYIPLVNCIAALSCEERDQHFALRNVVPNEERSSCGDLLRPQLDCQREYY
jgi:hypothetical protein